ncbi:4-hydroxy-tetrahydrodipicolinate reductase [bacterium]|nr:4-hydroxy-tetrahydrodipicolinate reductase [bacterium]
MRILVSGILGRMGRAVVDVAGEIGEFVVAGLDTKRTSIDEIPVYSDPEDLPTNIDIVIDFSTPEGTYAVAEWCLENRKPLISGTTGLDDEVMGKIRELAGIVPVFYSTNMSLGVALMGEFVKSAAKFFPDADVEIVEIHHRRKADAPSGTAKTFAQLILSARGWDESTLTYGRQGFTGERPKEQIGIHSVRAGSIVGEHQILFVMPEEEIILIHRALDRKLFARGALTAAKWLLRKKAGLYSPGDIIKSKLEG